MIEIGINRLVPFSLVLGAVLASAVIMACGDSLSSRVWPTPIPNPTISESEAIEIGKSQLAAVLREIDAAGYENARVRVGAMRLGRLQELTESDIYSEDSPRLYRQIWAVQIGGAFPGDVRPYDIPYGFGIVGIDAENGDIWLRARYDHEILVDE